MGSFYSFQMDEAKLTQIRQRSTKQISRFVITGLVFGFFTEWLLGNGRIYHNIIKKSTMRRLSTYFPIQRPRRRRICVSRRGPVSSSARAVSSDQ